MTSKEKLKISLLIGCLIPLQILVLGFITSSIYLVANKAYYYSFIIVVVVFVFIWHHISCNRLFNKSYHKSLVFSLGISLFIPLIIGIAVLFNTRNGVILWINSSMFCAICVYALLSIIQDKWKE